MPQRRAFWVEGKTCQVREVARWLLWFREAVQNEVE